MFWIGDPDADRIYYTFTNEDRSMQFTVRWTQARWWRTSEGHWENRDGREHWVSTIWRHNLISWEDEECGGIEVESSRAGGGPKLDLATLWRIARRTRFDLGPGDVCPIPPQPDPPDWEFFGEVASVQFTGDFVVDLPLNRSRLGPMKITLTTGQVLEVPEGGDRDAWCTEIQVGVWLREDDGCWIAGNLNGVTRVQSWVTFLPTLWVDDGVFLGKGFGLGRIQELDEGAVIVRGYKVALAEDYDLHYCCPPDSSLGDLPGLQAVFDVDRQEIVRINCVCQA